MPSKLHWAALAGLAAMSCSAHEPTAEEVAAMSPEERAAYHREQLENQADSLRNQADERADKLDQQARDLRRQADRLADQADEMRSRADDDARALVAGEGATTR